MGAAPSLVITGSITRRFAQGHALDGGPDNGQATQLGHECVNLVGAVSDITEQALDVQVVWM